MIELNYNQFKNTKFLFVVNTYGVFGGAERQALILAEYIYKNITQNVSFLALQDGESFKQKIKELGIETHCFHFKHQSQKISKLYQYFRLTQFIKKISPEVIIPYVAESNKVVAQVWRYTGAKFAFWNQREEGRKLYGSKLEQKLIRQIPAIVSNSYEGRNALVRTYGLKESEITVINNGIVPFAENVPNVDWYEKFELNPARPLISMIANITDRKDHTTLLKAWSIVIDNCKKNKLPLPILMLAGRKAHTYDQLRLLGFDLNLSEHILFLGEVDPVQSLIKKSLFCVFSSNLEGCPNGVLECMEQGKAVIGTDISGIQQALGKNFSKECLSEPNDPADLAKKIINLYKTPQLIEQIGHYNFKRIENEFSVKKMVNAHLHLIEKKMVSNK